MPEWTQCPSCRLKHALRPDGLCPRCRHPVATGRGSAPAGASPAGWGIGGGSAPAAPAPAAPAPDPWAAAAAAYPAAQPGPAGSSAPRGSFTVGGLVSGAFVTWGRNALWVIPLALLLYAPGAAAMYRMYAQMLVPGRPPPDPIPFLARAGVATGLLLLLDPLARLAVARAGVRRLRGGTLDLGDLLGSAIRSYLPAVGLLVLVGLAGAVSLVTVVGPLVLLTGWAAALPAMVTERLGPIAALRRSWELTRGLRWQVFAGFLAVAAVVIAVWCMVYGAVTALVVAAAVAAQGKNPEQLVGTMGVVQAVNVLLQGLYTSVFTTASAAAYHQLRAAAEGPSAAQLERVFE